MHLYDNREDFDSQLGTVKKWKRVGQALDIAPTLQRDVAYSIGDSLTYWWDDAAGLSSDCLTGHRRYLTVLAPFEGELIVKIANKKQLNAVGRYSDLTDRERFDGPASFVSVPQGGVLVADVDEALAVTSLTTTKAVQLQVTVEGYSFPNK